MDRLTISILAMAIGITLVWWFSLPTWVYFFAIVIGVFAYTYDDIKSEPATIDAIEAYADVTNPGRDNGRVHILPTLERVMGKLNCSPLGASYWVVRFQWTHETCVGEHTVVLLSARDIGAAPRLKAVFHHPVSDADLLRVLPQKGNSLDKLLAELEQQYGLKRGDVAGAVVAKGGSA